MNKSILIDRMNNLLAHAVYGELTGSPSWGDAMQELIPAHMRQSLIRWVGLGIYPGGFLTAVLENDLFGAYRKADDINSRCIRDYIIFLHNYAPSNCFGSYERAERWAESGGMIGQREKAEEIE